MNDQNGMIKRCKLKGNVYDLNHYRELTIEFGKKAADNIGKSKVKTDRQRVAEVQKKQFDKYR